MGKKIIDINDAREKIKNNSKNNISPLEKGKKLSIKERILYTKDFYPMIDPELRSVFVRNFLIGFVSFIASLIMLIFTKDFFWTSLGLMALAFMIFYDVYMIYLCSIGEVIFYEGKCVNPTYKYKFRNAVLMENDIGQQFIIFIDGKKIGNLKENSYIKCYARDGSAFSISENQFTVNSYIAVKVIKQPSAFSQENK